MLIVIPGATTKKITLNMLKETTRELKWYTRISPLNTEVVGNKEQERHKTYEKLMADINFISNYIKYKQIKHSN